MRTIIYKAEFEKLINLLAKKFRLGPCAKALLLSYSKMNQMS